MTDGALVAAWDALHDAAPPHWYVGQPSFHDERNEWLMYAFDERERPKSGARSREWTAIGATELEYLLEMAHCLRELGEGRALLWSGADSTAPTTKKSEQNRRWTVPYLS